MFTITAKGSREPRGWCTPVISALAKLSWKITWKIFWARFYLLQSPCWVNIEAEEGGDNRGDKEAK